MQIACNHDTAGEPAKLQDHMTYRLCLQDYEFPNNLLICGYVPTTCDLCAHAKAFALMNQSWRRELASRAGVESCEGCEGSDLLIYIFVP